MTNEYRRTLCDIDIIINEINEKEKNKIPVKLRKMIHENKLDDYKSDIKVDIPIEEQQLHKDTVAFLAMLYLNYWCENEEEKKELKSILIENEKIYQEKMQEKYNIDNIFNKKQEELSQKNKNNEEMQIVKYKESIIKKVLSKIFSFFRRKK